MPKQNRATSLAIIGTYPPQRCGIATFSHDLYRALQGQASLDKAWVVALDDERTPYDYPPEVRFEVRKSSPADYVAAAEFINAQEVDAVSLQHEFGIFGGEAGADVVHLLERLQMPVLTTLHTVLETPTDEQRAVMAEVDRHSQRLIVMSQGARRLLMKIYGIPRSRISVIPHGVPDLPFLDTSYHKDEFKLAGKKVILLFGLLSRGKGLEYVVEALPAILAQHPDVVFVAAGETHPGVKQHEGESYRSELRARALELGIPDKVIFYDHFMNDETLAQLLSIGDVFVTPYLSRDQIVSGVLSFALGAGKAIVSSPYLYAEELLADNRGRLVPFRDADAIAHEVNDLLDNEQERQAMRKRAYALGQKMVWSNTGKQYLKALDDVLFDRKPHPNGTWTPVRSWPPKFDHLSRLTDDTGILQHAFHNVPDRSHGYCTDDNARALIVAVMAARAARGKAQLAAFANRYLSFLHHAFVSDSGRFRNFMSYDRRWLETSGSEDSQGRALWALGLTVGQGQTDDLVGPSAALFEQALPVALELTSPRAIAFSLIGIDGYLQRYEGASEVKRVRRTLATALFDRWRANAAPDWPWLEDALTYANGVIPHALLVAGRGMQDAAMLDAGLKTLDWLTRLQSDPLGHFAPVGNDGWMSRDGRKARFDQQPLEAQHMVDALLEAHRITGEKRWHDAAGLCVDWYLGRNDLGEPVRVAETGGCGDGLSGSRISRNQGAESTLAWLHASIAFHLARREADVRAVLRDVRPPARVVPINGPNAVIVRN